jgi:trigger factor
MTDEIRPDPNPQDAATATEPVTEPAASTTQEGEGEEKSTKLHQQVEMRDVGPCKKHIKVTIERADIDARLDEKYGELVTEANVPGFRPGKAPMKIIKRRFAKDVGDEVRRELLMASLEQLATEQDVAPLSPPDLDPRKIEIPKEGPLVYEFDVEVRPQFDLPDYKGLKLKRPVKTFTDADVEEEERRILARFGQLVPKPDGVAGLGDYVVVDLVTRQGDRLVGQIKELTARVEPRLAFKDGVAERFADQMKDARAGDTRTIDITLSENAADASLRSQTVRAQATVKDIKTLRLPELTHEFLHELGVHSVDQLRETIRVILQRRLAYTQRQSAREQVLSHIAAAAQWELPHDLLRRQARSTLARRVMEMRSSGISDDEIRSRQRLLEQDAIRNTTLALKEHFVLQKIAEVEKIDVDEDDINDEINRIAEQDDESPRRVRARLEKEDLMEALAAEIIEAKALDLVLESAVYEDVPLGGSEAGPVATVEEQAVPGEMHDPTAPPPEAEEKAEAPPAEKPAETPTPKAT